MASEGGCVLLGFDETAETMRCITWLIIYDHSNDEPKLSSRQMAQNWFDKLKVYLRSQIVKLATPTTE